MLIDHGDNATMKLKPFAIAATQVGFVEATHNNTGWAIRFRNKNSGQVACSIRAGETRHWRNIDTLIRQLRKAGYRGRLIVPVDAQQELIG
jgi:hypothetical protein